MSTPDLSIVILTFNETVNLPRLFKSIEPLQCETFVVDSGSTDGTQDLVRQHGVESVQHPFESHAKQWSWALENLPIHATWVLALDADQYLTPKAAGEIVALFSGQDRLSQVNGIYINRRQVFRGQWIRHGGYYPKYLLKLFRRSQVFFDPNDLVDHHFYVNGRTQLLDGDLIEENTKEDDIGFWVSKHVRYAKLLAEEEIRRQSSPPPLKPSVSGSPDQRTIWLKRLWWRLPSFVRPFLFFFYRYFIRLGFLDGKQGLIFHFMQTLWFRLLVDVELDSRKKTALKTDRAYKIS
jgi:glycosyltransferase involved in cell wall biosynthesis